MCALRIPVVIVDDEGTDDDEDVTLVSCLSCFAWMPSRRRVCPDCAGSSLVTPETQARQRLKWPETSR